MKKRVVSISIAILMALSVFVVAPDTASAKSAKYWLKVNTKANVVNVYKKTNGKWVPVRVMLCSCGRSGTKTPAGTYSVKKKWRWHRLMGGVSGQYVSQFYGNYLFHSVLYTRYKKPNKCSRKQYNKLGKNASHGCVRLATMDAKWIYKNCKRGTKVTVYSSKNPGPLGKPARVKMGGKGKYGWDPTYDSKKNKHFNLTGPVITIKKAATIQVGQSFAIKAGVTAKSPYTFENLTSSVKVKKVEYRAANAKAFVTVAKKVVDTKRAGTYRILYSCYNSYCGRKTVTKLFTLTVKPKPVEDANVNNVGEPEETLVEPVTEETAVPETEALQEETTEGLIDENQPSDVDPEAIQSETDPSEVNDPNLDGTDPGGENLNEADPGGLSLNAPGLNGSE